MGIAERKHNESQYFRESTFQELLTCVIGPRSIALTDGCIRNGRAGSEVSMSLRDFLSKQFIDVIDWTEPEDGILAYRYPMQDREIQNGGKLTVRDSQAAVFVNEGKVADEFAPGLYTLNTQTLPILTYLKNWDKAFQSPFKSDVYFFSTRIQTDQHWGTQNPITIRDKEFGAIRLRGFGIYSYHLSVAKTFYNKISGTRDLYRVADLEGQLRNTIIAKMTDAFATSQVPFLDMAANQGALAEKISEQLKPSFADYGLTLDSFVVENLSLPDELQKVLDQRISMNVIGDMGRYTQYQVAQSIPIAAANEGGGAAGLGAGLGAGVAIGQAMVDAVKKSTSPNPGDGAAPATPSATGTPKVDTKFCTECGKPIPRSSKFCPECGKPQA
jgi:membrane protease subunit (stomatin/prohibitin family)